jgi:hypothetical protein
MELVLILTILRILFRLMLASSTYLLSPLDVYIKTKVHWHLVREVSRLIEAARNEAA